MKRMAYLRRLSALTKRYGAENIVYTDESGFKKHSYQRHGWAKRGTILYGFVHGNNHKSTNLIMAQRNGKWFAAETFQENCTAQRVNEWLEKTLIPKLEKPSVIVMDNAPFHKKSRDPTYSKKAWACCPVPSGVFSRFQPHRK